MRIKTKYLIPAAPASANGIYSKLEPRCFRDVGQNLHLHIPHFPFDVKYSNLTFQYYYRIVRLPFLPYTIDQLSTLGDLEAMTATEAFPLLSTSDKLASLAVPSSYDKPRDRRRSSGLGGDIRGDTSAPALATLDIRPPSPGTLKVRSPVTAAH